ncbi:pre-mRNA splicing helicase [Phlyctema vagabunda]|uniref:DNA 3'-5' helicase n=1 Tax=Phlyctema vagabunda TaxID=108571 RepID=A0ABR4P912_9HELO
MSKNDRITGLVYTLLFQWAALMADWSDSLGGFTDTAPLSQESSPLARINQRHSASQLKPFSSSLNYDSTPSRSQFVPQTPRKQTVSHVLETPRAKLSSQAPPSTHGIQLIPLQKLPDRLRKIFPYDLFNAVQSKCFDSVYNTNSNVVVSAPTGSGKTVILELAICRLISSHSNSSHFKIVYQAPMKSLCSERMRDWENKFQSLNLKCAELTGDTSLSEMNKVRDASIIITTPEKWDSITRKWKDHIRLLQMVKLFLIDEVHILNDSRGATLEAVVSRMKTIGANVRFVALSATIPNSEDVAIWLGKDHTNNHLPAHREIFGPEFRPVQLQKFVHGYEPKPNDFIFDNALGKRLPHLIAKYSHRKPILIFCFTKTSCEKTAASLAEWWSSQANSQRVWPAPVNVPSMLHKDLKVSVACGVAFHHAGLDPQDRRAVELAFHDGLISVICCTSTLAVGVNLPCHLVVLKGTTCYKETGPCEYSDLEVMQMLGRAGRPQFDDSGVAVIMTRHEQVDRYTKMISGQETLESKLHLNLINHLNSEIGLGTIQDISTAHKWLAGTFLNVRMRQNPKYYKIDGIEPGCDPDQTLARVCERDIKLLQNWKLIVNGEQFTTTEYGDAMSRYMVPFDTMKLLLQIPNKAKVEEILVALCKAAEFKDLKMRANERNLLRELNKSCFMKFPVKENISTTAHKAFIATQVQLGGIELPSNDGFTQTMKRQFMSDKTIIFERIQRLLRCLTDCKAFDCDAISTRNALDLVRAISAGFWENSPLQLRQVPQIGPVAMQKLASNDIKTVDQLASLDAAGIERVIGRNPPFGTKLQAVVKCFPRLTLVGEVMGKMLPRAGKPVRINVKAKLGFVDKIVPNWLGRSHGVTFIAETSDGNLVHFWRGNVRSLQNGFELIFIAELPDAESQVMFQLACDDIVGTVRCVVLDHQIPASAFASAKLSSTPASEMLAVSTIRQLSNEFGEDQFEDEEFLAAVENVERTARNKSQQEFQDVDDVIVVSQAESKKSTPAILLPKTKPTRMDNGRFECNHACRSGVKNGKPCKHKCCHEGLDKPRKVKPRKPSENPVNLSDLEDMVSFGGGDATEIDNGKVGKRSKKQSVAASQRLKASKKSNKNDPIVEYIDLEEDEQPALKDCEGSYTVSTDAQRDQSVQKSIPEYGWDKNTFEDRKEMTSVASAASPSSDPFEDGYFRDDESLPSLAKLIKRPSNHHKVEDWEVPDVMQHEPELPDQFDNMGQDDDLEAAMVGLDDSLRLRGEKEGTPKLSTSFVESVLDFSACLSPQKTLKSSPPPTGSLKREAADFLGKIEPEVKRQRPDKDEPLKEEIRSIPAWVDEYDGDLMAELRGLVEFVD